MRFLTTLLLLGAAHHAMAQQGPDAETSASYSAPAYCKTPDFIVVGGGAAGCVVASRLSESGRACVTLLEAGYDESTVPDTQIILKPGHPIAVRPQGPMQWQAYSNETNGIGPTQNFLELYGRLLGGGTSINGADYSFPVIDDHNAGIFGNLPGWSYQDLLPLRVQSESYDNYDDPTQSITSDFGQFRGTNGPIHVQQYPRNAYSLGVVEAMKSALNLPWNPDNNNYTSYGVAQLQINARGDNINNAVRADTWTSYLKPYVGVRANLNVITGAHVTKILTKVNPSNDPTSGKPVAYGVQYVGSDGVSRTLLTRKEVILTAGALHTPYILQLSGIGNSTYLSSFNIPTVVDSPHVGKNFIDKITFPFVVSLNYTDVDWTQYTASFNSGTQPNVASNLQDTTLIVQQVIGAANQAQMTVMGVMLYHSGVGSVGIHHPNPVFPPLFHFNFWKNQASDLALARSIIRKQRAIIAALPASILASTGKIVTATELVPGFGALPANPSDAVLNAWILKNHGAGFHGISSARMAASIEDGVVDEQLRVFGVSGLRVADISVLRVNAQGPTAAYAVTVAEKAATLIRQQWGI